MNNKKLQQKLKRIPKNPGVYIFKNKRGEVIYIGKAAVLKNRVRQYFAKAAMISSRLQALKEEITNIEWKKCQSEIDALIEEAKQIKKYHPKFNVVLRDDKNYFFVGITKEKYPCIFTTHQPIKAVSPDLVEDSRQSRNYRLKADFIGPFTDGQALKATLKMLRQIYPHRYCRKMPRGPVCPLGKQCAQKELKRDFAPYPVPKTNAEVKNNVRDIIAILTGKKQAILKKIKRQMLEAAKKEQFRSAARYKNRLEDIKNIFAHRVFLEEFQLIKRQTEWQKIQEQIQLLLRTEKAIRRIEGYDISNIMGKYAVGSMVVFQDGIPDKNQYRKFKIKYSDMGLNPVRNRESSQRASVSNGADDPKMMKEILARRAKHADWQSPDLIVVDGGITQLNAALSVLPKNQLVIALAKQKEKIYLPNAIAPILAEQVGKEFKLFVQHLRDEAHRFAITYHKKLREKALHT